MGTAMPSSSPSSSSSSGGTSAKRRRAKYERKFLRAAARGSLRGCKKALKRASSRGSGAGFLDVQASDHDGRTALHLACASGDDDLARWLIKRGADVTSTDARGDTPAHLAAHRAPDNVAIARRLTRAGASAHARNDAGETPSSIAERAAESRAARMREFDARREARTRRARDADDYEGLGSGPSRGATIEEMEWREKLRAEAALGDAIDEFGGGAAGIGTRDEMDAFYASYRDDSESPGNAYAWREEEEAYAEYMRAGMAARRRRRRDGDDCDDDDDDARRRRRDSAAEAQARATRERDEAAQRVLDEERRKDAEWRERTTRRAGTGTAANRNVLQTDFAAHRRRWGVAAAMADRGESIAYADVPWPFDPESAVEPDERVVRDVLLGPEGARMGPSEARRALRSEMLRWHPDKFFASTVGERVAAEDVERTRRGVNAVAGVIASLFRRSAGS